MRYTVNKNGLWAGQQQLKKGQIVSGDLWGEDGPTLQALVESGRLSLSQEEETDKVAEEAIPVPEDVVLVNETDEAVSETGTSTSAASDPSEA